MGNFQKASPWILSVNKIKNLHLTCRVKVFRGRKVHSEFDIKVEQVSDSRVHLLFPLRSVTMTIITGRYIWTEIIKINYIVNFKTFRTLYLWC